MDKISVDRELRRIYEDYHAAGPSEWRRIAAEDKARHIVELCGSVRHDAIVEVGAGDGSVLARLDDFGFATRMHAVEIAESAVETIRRRQIPSLVACDLFDGYRIPYRDKDFDLAVATHVIEHVEHPRLLLRELKRVAEHVFIEVPLEYNMQGIRDRRNSERYGHINFFSSFLIATLLEQCGFAILDSRICNSSLPVYRYQSGWKGIPKFLFKQTALTVFPRLAGKLFSYLFAALCKGKS